MVNNDVDLKGKAMNVKLEAFAQLVDPFRQQVYLGQQVWCCERG
jgi:hypothetical protein